MPARNGPPPWAPSLRPPPRRALRPRGLGSWARHGLGGGGAGGGAGGGGAGVAEGVGSRTAHAARPKGAAQLQRKLVVVLLGGSSHAELRCAHGALAGSTPGGDGGDGGGGWQLYFGSTAVLALSTCVPSRRLHPRRRLRPFET